MHLGAVVAWLKLWVNDRKVGGVKLKNRQADTGEPLSNALPLYCPARYICETLLSVQPLYADPKVKNESWVEIKRVSFMFFSTDKAKLPGGIQSPDQCVQVALEARKEKEGLTWTWTRHQSLNHHVWHGTAADVLMEDGGLLHLRLAP